MNSNKIKIEYKKLDEITPYINNPRNNDAAVDKVASSIAEFGFKVPIVIDRDGIIVTGHTRYKASRKLGLEEVPCIYADDLTPEQVKAFRIADNKTSEYASWDEELLKLEFEGLDEMGVDLGLTAFTEKEFNKILGLEDEGEEKYTKKVTVPQYEIKGECPEFSEMFNIEKANSLLEKINASNVSEEEKEFLRYAAMRHNVFHYGNIAEYYAHANPEMQELMEESALVIIDFDDAIRNGYVKMSGLIEEMIAEEEENNA